MGPLPLPPPAGLLGALGRACPEAFPILHVGGLCFLVLFRVFRYNNFLLSMGREPRTPLWVSFTSVPCEKGTLWGRGGRGTTFIPQVSSRLGSPCRLPLRSLPLQPLRHWLPRLRQPREASRSGLSLTAWCVCTCVRFPF